MTQTNVITGGNISTQTKKNNSFKQIGIYTYFRSYGYLLLKLYCAFLIRQAKKKPFLCSAVRVGWGSSVGKSRDSW